MLDTALTTYPTGQASEADGIFKPWRRKPRDAARLFASMTTSPRYLPRRL
jgi:hypothetical protein